MVIITGTIYINTLRLRHNGRHFTDNIFKCIFLNENVSILIKISLNFNPKGPINDIPALVQIMAWHQPGEKQLFEPVMASLLMLIWSLGLCELTCLEQVPSIKILKAFLGTVFKVIIISRWNEYGNISLDLPHFYSLPYHSLLSLLASFNILLTILFCPCWPALPFSLPFSFVPVGRRKKPT